jgi:hypothetical protein
MANGDDAQAAGYPIVPPTGDDGLVKNGYDEINKTRDFVARLKNLVPNGKSAYRSAAGITSGTASPTGGNDGDIYFKIIG